MVFNESLLHDLNMGYYTLKTRTPHSSVGYNSDENKFFHQWSLESAGKEYGYAKLKELIPLHDYLTLPNSIVEEIIVGIVEGERERFQQDKEKQQEPDASKDGLTKEQLKELKKAGLIKS